MALKNMAKVNLHGTTVSMAKQTTYSISRTNAIVTNMSERVAHDVIQSMLKTCSYIIGCSCMRYIPKVIEAT